MQFCDTHRSTETFVASRKYGRGSSLVHRSCSADFELHRARGLVKFQWFSCQHHTMQFFNSHDDSELCHQTSLNAARIHHYFQVSAPYFCLMAISMKFDLRFSIENSLGHSISAIIFLSLCILLFAVIGQGMFAGVKRGPGICADISRIESVVTLGQASRWIQTLTTHLMPFCCCLRSPQAKGERCSTASLEMF